MTEKKRPQGSVEKTVLDAVNAWNRTLDIKHISFEYVVDVVRRIKKFHINHIDFFEIEIGELLLIKRFHTVVNEGQEDERPETKDVVIFRIEHLIPNKEINERMNQIKWVNRLYEAFLYEMFGNFSNVVNNLHDKGELSEYDLTKDRYKGDPVWENRQIEIFSVDSLTHWYKLGDKFDVFRHGESGYIVYSWSEEGKKNRGFAVIPTTDAKPTVPIIIGLDEKPLVR